MQFLHLYSGIIQVSFRSQLYINWEFDHHFCNFILIYSLHLSKTLSQIIHKTLSSVGINPISEITYLDQSKPWEDMKACEYIVRAFSWLNLTLTKEKIQYLASNIWICFDLLSIQSSGKLSTKTGVTKWLWNFPTFTQLLSSKARPHKLFHKLVCLIFITFQAFI